MSSSSTNMRLKLPLLCFLLQLLLIILFAIFIRYDDDTDSKEWFRRKAQHNITDSENEFYFRYPSFQDVHVMIFVGFGFLMTFLRKYGYGSVGFNFVLAAFSLQWATLVQGWLHGLKEDGKIHIGIESMINADFCTGSVLISFGALLGKTSPVQLLIMTVFESALFPINEYILLSLLEIKDAGGSMTIHSFGAYFGLTIARVLYRPQLDKSRQREGSVYHSDLFAMIGAIYLWMFWPSFNSAVTSLGSAQHRTALNTYYSLAACTLATFATSSIVNQEGKLDMPILDSKLKIQDTCGVHNLHGMPGILGGMVGAILASMATKEIYGDGLQDVFPLLEDTRSASQQGLYQALGLAVTLGFALIGGIIVGFIMKLPIWGAPPDTQCFTDQPYWELPEDDWDHGEMVSVKIEEVEKHT
ncbi:ammonium transporter Rh type B isoform X2 [Heterodontus francisci]|uniref:ammonium transporter Rh type B isoform X2 n=1 Tax=Heterodontus francisci TaxID=7792 RepID=UPI00355BDBB3